MKKHLLLLILAQIGVTTFVSADVEIEQDGEDLGFIMSLDYDLDCLLNRLKKLEEYMDSTLTEESDLQVRTPEGIGGQLRASVAEEDDFVVISFIVPDVDTKKIDLEVDGKCLKGTIPVGGRSIGLEITDGMLMVSSHASGAQERAENYQAYEHMSTQMMSLPARVANLEATEVEYENDNLVIRVPKFKDKKPEHKKLMVTVK